MEPISPQMIKDKFNNQNIKVFTNSEDLSQYWEGLDKTKGAFLMMSSGNFGGLDLRK